MSCQSSIKYTEVLQIYKIIRSVEHSNHGLLSDKSTDLTTEYRVPHLDGSAARVKDLTAMWTNTSDKRNQCSVISSEGPTSITVITDSPHLETKAVTLLLRQVLRAKLITFRVCSKSIQKFL